MIGRPGGGLESTQVIVHDASALIDLRKGGLLNALLRLPFRFVVPLPVRAWELLDFTAADWRALDLGGMETHDLPPEEVEQAFRWRAQHPKLSPNDCFCLVTTQTRERGILLTGDNRLRLVARSLGLEVHGVLWIVDQLAAASACPDEVLIAALEQWRDDAAVFLPGAAIEIRLQHLRKS